MRIEEKRGGIGKKLFKKEARKRGGESTKRKEQKWENEDEKEKSGGCTSLNRSSH